MANENLLVLSSKIEKYPNFKVIIYGVNANYFDKIIEFNIFVLSNFVLKGYNAILRFNDKD